VAIDLTTIPAAIKTLYSPSVIREQTQKDHPIYAMLRKRTDLVGSPFNSFLVYGDASSGSSNFTNAAANTGAPANSVFSLTASQQYAIPTIDNKTMELTKNDKGAFVQALKFAMDGALREAAMGIALSIIGDGSGGRGTVKSVNTGSNQLTLTDVNQTTNFNKGAILTAGYPSSGNWALRASTMTLTGIDRTAGVLTFAGGLVAALAAGDVLARQGDMTSGSPWNNGAGTTAGGTFAGLAGFLPLSRPVPGAGDSFAGLDRSADAWRLAGGFYNGTGGKSAMEVLNGAVAVSRREGGKPDYFFCNETYFNQIQNDIQGKVEFETVEAFNEPQIGFDTIVIRSGAQKIRVMADNSIPSNVGYLLQLDTWTLWSAGGPAVRILSYPNYGQAYIPSSTADALQVRVGGYPLLECTAPGFNVAIQLK
jgi:hypothetical protein